MNTSTLEARQKANTEFGLKCKKEMDRLIAKGWSEAQVTAKYQSVIDRWHDEQEAIDHLKGRKSACANPKYAALALSGGDLGTAPDIPTTKATGAQISPLAFSDTSLKAMYKAFTNRQTFSIKAETKAFSTVESLLPAQLAPNVVGQIHEWRILDHLPSIGISAPTYEHIVHNFASDTGGPDVVAEGAAKPEYVPDVTSSIATAQKVAMHTGISYETLADWPQWLGYVQGQSFKLMADKENQQLLYGTGTSNQILGFFNTSGILSHNCSSDPGSYTPIDSIEAAITQLRTGSALAEPSLFICHPTSWSSIRRTKTTTNAYVLGDPLHEAVSTLWGIPVLITTAITNGQGLLVSTQKFGNALIREGIVMHQGFSGTDFIDNVVRYVFEERIALAVERPQAVLAITNLPTS